MLLEILLLLAGIIVYSACLVAMYIFACFFHLVLQSASELSRKWTENKYTKQ